MFNRTVIKTCACKSGVTVGVLAMVMWSTGLTVLDIESMPP